MPSPLAGVARFPRARLGHAPTPIDAAPNLGAALGIDLYMKRDDCTGLAFGGNKVRQLEFHFGEARARGADTVLVTGAVQSNLVRIAAAAARRLGMEIHIQIEDRVAGMDETYRSSGNLLLDRVLGATLHPFPEGEDEAAADAAMEVRAAALAAGGRKPYVIRSAPGHPPLGGLGYVAAAGEIADQSRTLGVGFDAVVCASGSALTHAGLLVGLRALGERAPVLGICVRRDAASQGARVARVASALAAMIERPDAFDAGDVEVSDAVLAPGYGRLNEAVREAMALAARREGLLLDPVYTAKAMAGLIAHVRSGRIAPGGRVLFVHTGGQPALFAYADSLGPWLSEAPEGRGLTERAASGQGKPGAAGGVAALASRRIHSRNARSSGRWREAAVVIRQQRSGAFSWRSKSGTSVRFSSSFAISIGRPMAAPSPLAAAWTSIE